MSIIVFTNIKLTNKNQIFSLLLIFLVGKPEFVGVNYGLIFGEYTMEIIQDLNFWCTILIGLNWVILTVICAIASILIKILYLIDIIQDYINVDYGFCNGAYCTKVRFMEI